MAVCFTLTAAFSVRVVNTRAAYAEAEHVWTRDEVTSLDMLRHVPVNQIADWPQYNSRDYDIVTSVKNQGKTNLCWVYGSLAAMETNILRQGLTEMTKDALDLDEEEFAKAASGKWDDPLNIADDDNNQKSDTSIVWNKEGAISWVAQFAARGQGVYQEGEINDEQPKERYSSYFLRNAITCDNEVDRIKKLIAQYGGVAFTYHSGIMNKTYLYATGANDHASFIVGWDDTIPKGSFYHASGAIPQRDGGWIVKNSYGTAEFENGYCYLSYDSALFEITAFDMMPADEYEWCYNYSNLIYSSKGYNSCKPDDIESAEYAAIYKAQKGGVVNEHLKGVSVGVDGKNMQISVSIYVNVDEAAIIYSKNSTTFNPKKGDLVATATYSAPTTGIYTIPIPGLPILDKDAYFTVLVKVSGGSVVYDFFAYRSGTMTYVLNNGKWDDLSSPMSELAIRGLLCIKALTVTRAEGEVIDLSDSHLSLAQMSYVYTGAEIEPEVTVTLGDAILALNKDYTLSYENNINAGQATVTATGIGKHTGKTCAHFTISKADAPKLPDEYTELFIEKAKTLKDIELPDGWKWVDENFELIVGEQSVYAEYIGDDRENYLTTSVEIKLTVKSTSDDTDEPDPEDPNGGESSGGETKPDPNPPPTPGPEDPEDPENPDSGDDNNGPKNPDNDDTTNPDTKPQQPDNNNQSGGIKSEDEDDKMLVAVLSVSFAVVGVGAIGGVIYFIIRRKRKLK
ncbi:MAG: hypothetical protein J1G01_01500 [Clostridiales bacterium]|nr:hypothetical protein [Clostridiales bacterium]